MFVGPVEVGTIFDWNHGEGSVVSWHPSPASRAKALEAPISAVPPSYMQAQHLRGFCEQAALGLEYSRLMIASCKIAGRCDIRAMTHIINAHLRRHDTYRSWFEYEDADHIVRRTIRDAADIEFVPTRHGEMTPEELREHILGTPDPVQWDCFSFGVIQGADQFTFYVSLDHLHMDAMFAGVLATEFHMMYNALVGGGAPISLPDAGSYDDYCVRQRQSASALTLESPQVRTWVEFAENNNGSLPEFPLPLGDPSVLCTGGILTAQLMDEQQTARFESACIEAGARFSGGVFACIALAEHELTGAETYYGATPIDIRSTPAEFLTVGWFTGLIPITVPVTASFPDTVRAAQKCFDSGTDLAHVPFDRVVELAPWLSRPRPNFPVVNYLDGGVAPLSGVFASLLQDLNMGVWFDGRFSYQFCIFVNRMGEETIMTVLFPDNPIARESVANYFAVMKSVYVRIADGRGAAPLRNFTQA